MSYDRFKVALRASLLTLGINQTSLVLLSLNRRLQGSLQSKAAEPSARFTVDEKVEKEEWMPWEPDEKEGRYILAQVMEGGNFGQYMKGYRPGLKWNYVWNVCRRNMHLLRWYPSEAI